MNFIEGDFLLAVNNSSDIEIRSLAYYLAKQLDSLFPGKGLDDDAEKIFAVLPEVINRLGPILKAVNCFDAERFNCLNSLQYTTFLYLLANELWTLNTSTTTLPERLFCLNRALNSIDLFYAVHMPAIFFISHGVGAVLGDAVYGERLVIFQNVTVGRIGNKRPRIGDNVVLYPGAIVTGDTVIGNNCVVSAGTVLHNVKVPNDVIVVSMNGQLTFKPRNRNYINLYFDGEI